MRKKIGLLCIIILAFAFFTMDVHAKLDVKKWKTLKAKFKSSLDNKDSRFVALKEMKKADSENAVKLLFKGYDYKWSKLNKENADLEKELDKLNKYLDMVYKAKSHSRGDIERWDKIKKEMNVLEKDRRKNVKYLNLFYVDLGGYSEEESVESLIKLGLQSKKWWLQVLAA